MAYRKQQEELLGYSSEGGCKHCEAKKLGDVVTINLTMLHGGSTNDGGKTYALNVIPAELKAGFDIRIPPSVEMETIRKLLDEWTEEEGLSWEIAPWRKEIKEHFITDLDNTNKKWFDQFSKLFSSNEMNIKLNREIFPASTDSR